LLEIQYGRRIINALFLDGKRLKDLAPSALDWVVPEPQEVAALKGNQYKPNVLDNRKRWLYMQWEDWEQPSRFFLDPHQVEPGEKTILIDAMERYHGQKLLGRVRIRPAKLIPEVARPFSYSIPVNAYQTELRVGLRQRVVLSSTVKVVAEIRVMDELGSPLWKDQRVLELGSKTEDHTFVIPARTPRDYRAEIRFRREGATEVLAEWWSYFFPLVKQYGNRIRYSLEGPWWEERPFSLSRGLADVKKLDAKGWQPTYFPCQRKRSCDKPFKIAGKAAHRMLLRRRFRLPASMSERTHFILRVSGVMEKATLLLNGHELGAVDFTQTGRDFAVTPYLRRKGENELIILLDSWPAFAKGGPYHDGDKFPHGLAGSGTLGGSFLHIRDDISLWAVSPVRVIRPRIHYSLTEKKLYVRAQVINEANRPVDVRVRGDVLDRGQSVKKFASEQVKIAPKGVEEVRISLPWADPHLWSPESPYLYALELETEAGGKVLDRTRERFGCREIRVDDRHVYLNGKILRLRGRMYDKMSFALGMLDADNVVNFYRALKKEHINITRDSIGVHPAFLWQFYDDIGFFGGTQSLPWCNGQALWRVRDPQAHDNFTRHVMSYSDWHFNHPSIIQWNFGNELHGTMYAAPEIQRLLAEDLRRIKQHDPTRFTKADGSGNPGGAADVTDIHYLKIGVLTGKIQAAKVAHHDVRSKPVMTGEYSWNRYPTSGYFWLGEIAMKPSPIRVQRGWDNMICEMINLEHQRNADDRKYRRAGIFGFVALNEVHFYRNLNPVYVDFDDDYEGTEVHHGIRRFWSGQQVTVPLLAVNDREENVTIELSISLREHGRENEVLWYQHRLQLTPGETRRIMAQGKVPEVKEVRQLQVLLRYGKETRDQTWFIFPEPPPVPVLNGLGLFDPQQTPWLVAFCRRACPDLTVLKSLKNLISDKIRMLIIGPAVDPAALTPYQGEIEAFMEQGGSLLVLDQQHDIAWLPVDKLRYVKKGEARPNFTNAYFLDHPIGKGLSPDFDFSDWNPVGYVRSGGYVPPKRGCHRV
ncbi:MAG: hypothetical protein D6820_17230, partial [Lentisphaerae bacterium]